MADTRQRSPKSVDCTLHVTPGMGDDVLVFWDNSNIFIPAKFVANRREGASAEFDIRIQFDNLFNLARGGRKVTRGICVGSVPPELEHVWKRLRDTGVTVELYERGEGSGTEQGVDQCLQVHMLRALADIDPPQIAVLLTGDGAGYETGAGFHADLERLHKRGWGIEVLSWDIACNKKLKTWAQTAGVYIPLENYYNSITFRERLRRVEPLSLTRRPKAITREHRLTRRWNRRRGTRWLGGRAAFPCAICTPLLAGT